MSWIQKGQDIDGKMAGDNSGFSVSLSSEINVIMSIDKGSLECDINKYIAPHFNITKMESNDYHY